MGGQVGLCVALVNPSVQEAEDAMGCSGISHPQDHQKLTPFLLCLLRIMSRASAPLGQCPQGKIYGQGRLSAL